jgi:hypothetical protein
MRFLASFLIPFALLFVGGFVKKLARGTPGFRRHDWYMGVELTLTAFVSGLTQALDALLKLPWDGRTPVPPEVTHSLAWGLLFAGGMFCALFPVLSMHQDDEQGAFNSREQWIYLLGICNAIGIGSMAVFLIWIKR